MSVLNRFAKPVSRTHERALSWRPRADPRSWIARRHRTRAAPRRPWRSGPRAVRASPTSPARPACRRRPCRSRSTAPAGWRRRPRSRIRDVADSLGYRPAPRRADAHPARDAHHRRAHAPGAVGHLLQPVLRRVLGGRRARRRAGGLRAPLHLAPPRLARPRDGPRDGRRRRSSWACRRTTRRWSRSAPPGCRWSWSTRARCPTSRRRDRRRGRRPRRPPSTCSRSAIATCSSWRSSRLTPGARHGARGRRRAAACAATSARSRRPGVDATRTHASSSAPATIEGGIAAFAAPGRTACRPTGVLAMSDAMAIGVLRAARELGLRVPDDLSSSASTTSTSASTRTRR